MNSSDTSAGEIPQEVEFEHAELITVCDDCGFAVHWSTDKYSPSSPFGESLGEDHYHGTEHSVVELSFGSTINEDQYPTVAEARGIESSRDELPDQIDRGALYEEMRELYKRGLENDF